LRWRTVIFTYVDYVLFALPGLVVSLWAQWRIWRARRAGSRIALGTRLSGAEIALAVMQASGVSGVEIERAEGELSNHYDEGGKILRLSAELHDGQSAWAAGVAAHEAGHAIQEAAGYWARFVRRGVAPLAAIGSTVCWLMVTAGLLIGMTRLVQAGIELFSAGVVLQAVNLPVEFDASRRGRKALASTMLVAPDEEAVVEQVVNAAAWTYVACALTGVSVLVDYLGGHWIWGRGRARDGKSTSG
jgi:uncharacterized protein